MKTDKLLTARERKLFKELRPLFDGGLSIVHFTSVDECDFDYYLEKYKDKVFNCTHFHAHSHGIIDSRLMKEIMKVIEKHNAFFIMYPKLKMKNVGYGFEFSILQREK